MYLYLLPARLRFQDARAAALLLRECYGVLRCGVAPMGLGILYETSRSIPTEEQDTLCIVPWH